MTEIGKFSIDSIEKLVFPHLGKKSSSVLVGPGHGRDNAVIKFGDEQVLVATADSFAVSFSRRPDLRDLDVSRTEDVKDKPRWCA